MEIVKTKDGSDTIFVKELDEFYHSPRGAVSESKYVFIKNGLEEYLKLNKCSSISILEIGLGTGLNALLSFEFSIKNNIKINYTGIEKNPIPNKLNIQLNYTDTLNDEFKKIIYSEWNKFVKLDSNFNLIKINSDIIDFETEEKYDVIFFDAFAKSKQRDIWSDEIIEKTSNLLKEKGIFVTYASTSQLKKQLKNLNFEIIKKKGALGKREMTLAIKKI